MDTPTRNNGLSYDPDIATSEHENDASGVKETPQHVNNTQSSTNIIGITTQKKVNRSKLRYGAAVALLLVVAGSTINGLQSTQSSPAALSATLPNFFATTPLSASSSLDDSTSPSVSSEDNAPKQKPIADLIPSFFSERADGFEVHSGKGRSAPLPPRQPKEGFARTGNAQQFADRHPLLEPGRQCSAFPLWAILTNLSAGVTRSGLMRDPMVCGDVLEAMAEGSASSSYSPSSSIAPLRGCEWYFHGLSPVGQTALQTQFSQSVRSHLLKHAKLSLNDPAAVADALRLLKGLPAETDAGKAMTPQHVAVLRRQLRRTYLPGGPSSLTADNFAAALTTVYTCTVPAMHDFDGQNRLSPYLSQLKPSDLYLETTWHQSMKNNGGWGGGNGSSFVDAYGPSFRKSYRPFPFATPTPQQLADLSLTSPTLVLFMADALTSFRANGLPMAWEGSAAAGGSENVANAADISSKHDEDEGQKWATVANVFPRNDAHSPTAASAPRHTYRDFYHATVQQITTEARKPVSASIQSLSRLPSPMSESAFSSTSNVGGVLLTMRDRLVRLSPTLNPHFEGPLIEGMRSAQRAAAADTKAEGTTTTLHPPFLEGVLAEAPPHVRSAPNDALAGTWNMSDLPPWLKIPARVNPYRCLNRNLALGTAAEAESGDVPPSTVANNTAAGEDADDDDEEEEEEEEKSILIFGSSHGRVLFTSLCNQYVGARALWNARRRGMSGSNPEAGISQSDALAVCGTARGGSNIISRHDAKYGGINGKNGGRKGKGNKKKMANPIAIAFKSVSYEYFQAVESIGRELVDHLKSTGFLDRNGKRKDAAGSHDGNNVPAHSTREVKKEKAIKRTEEVKNDVAAEMAARVQHFTARAARGRAITAAAAAVTGRGGLTSRTNTTTTAVASTPSPFQYSDLFVHSRDNEFASLKGLFTHVIFVNAIWEYSSNDASIGEYAESFAITLDLFEEVFAPKKIIVLPPQKYHSPPAMDATGEYYTVLDETLAFLSPTAADPHSPQYHPQMEAMERERYRSWSRTSSNNPQRQSRYRDAHLCAMTSTARDRVRQAWAEELLAITAKHHGAKAVEALKDDSSDVDLAPTPTPPRRRTEVEIMDVLAPTMQSMGSFFVDPEGHHYRSIASEVIGHKLLRDHVCPPRFVAVVRPPPDGDPTTTAATAGGYEMNYANSKLPYSLGKEETAEGDAALASGKIEVARVRQSIDSARRMPSLTRPKQPKGQAPASSLVKKYTYEIRDLFPLTKSPTAVVSEGLCRAIFDHPYSAMNSYFRAVRRNPTYGLRAPPEEEERRRQEGGSRTAAADGAAQPFWTVPRAPLPASVKSAPPPFPIGSSVKTYFPLEETNMIATLNFYNPFLMNTEAALRRASRFYEISRHNQATANSAQYRDYVNARYMNVTNVNTTTPHPRRRRALPPSAGDPINALISFPLYTSTRHNMDPLFVLRTLSHLDGTDPANRAGCMASRYEHVHSVYSVHDSGVQYPAHVFPLSQGRYRGDTYGQHCTEQAMGELRGRMEAYAYINKQFKLGDD